MDAGAGLEARRLTWYSRRRQARVKLFTIPMLLNSEAGPSSIAHENPFADS